MDISPSYSVNTPEATRHLLIATQGSTFKNDVLDQVIEEIKKRDVFIRVIDVSGLSKTEASKWDAVFVFHTWEFSKPPKPVALFAEKNKNSPNCLYFATSRVGTDLIEGVDGISGASIMSEASKRSNEIVSRINQIIYSS